MKIHTIHGVAMKVLLTGQTTSNEPHQLLVSARTA